jgi:hypothetical protein
VLIVYVDLSELVDVSTYVDYFCFINRLVVDIKDVTLGV